MQSSAQRSLQRESYHPWLMGVLVFALTLACYWPALHGGLVWDDAAHVTRPELRSWSGLARIWTDLHATQQFYPVLHTAFWLEHRVWGDATLGYHLINVLLHGMACCLFAGLLRGRLPAGAEWIAAVVLAVHPVAVESVAWISEQKNTLSLVFYLLAARSYLRFDTTRRPAAYAWATSWFLLALGTKSVTATLPAALLVVIWWQRGTVRWRPDVRPLLPWFAAGLGAGCLTAWVERTLIGATGAAFDLSIAERLLLAGRIIWFYLGKLVWPAGLSFVYPRWDVPVDALRWWGWLVATAGVTAVLWTMRGRARGPLAAWLFFVGSLFPALGFFNVYPFLFSYVADHFQYLPSLGIIALGAAIMQWILSRAHVAPRILGRAGLVVAVGTMVVLANQQSRTYRDSATLYRATLARNPDCWMAHSNLAVELANSPAQIPEALEHYATALRLKPDLAEAHNNLGNTLRGIPGRLVEAIAHFRSALEINARFPEARLNLANSLADLPGQLPEALAEYAETLRRHPDFAEAHFCYANTLARLPDRKDEAEAHYRETLRLRPAHAEANENLAALLMNDPARLDEALRHYQVALQLAPDRARTHFNYGVALERAGGRDEAALVEYKTALKLDPGYGRAHNNLGALYARGGQFDRARTHWETALALQPDNDDARRNLHLLDQREVRQNGDP